MFGGQIKIKHGDFESSLVGLKVAAINAETEAELQRIQDACDQKFQRASAAQRVLGFVPDLMMQSIPTSYLYLFYFLSSCFVLGCQGCSVLI